MEKLSIQEKAKRYDEALERAKEMIKSMTNVGGVAKEDDIQYLFPELKDSEDERIRKFLTKCVKENMFVKSFMADGFDKGEVLAWLEKQGEQKSVPKFKVGDTIAKKHDSNINDFGSFTITDITGGKYWYNDRIICDITEQDEWELYEPVRQKPAWSEDDEKMWFSAIEYIQTYPSHRKSVVDWLKSLKDRLIPQLKQEWSEEDKRIKDNCIEYVKAACLDRDESDECVDWLKSLRHQNTWKPSDEQMVQLSKYCPDNIALTSLYEQLKKLKG